MDPVSISLGCIALIPPITKASTTISKFILEVRDARKEMSQVRSELISLQSILEILAQDTKSCPEEVFPINLIEEIKSIIRSCENVVKEIEQCIALHTDDRGPKSMKWALFGRENMLKHQSSLNAYKSALNMAIEVLNLAINRGIKTDTQEILQDTTDLKEDTAQILREIEKLQAKLPDPAQAGSNYILHKYLDSLTNYAASSLGYPSNQDQDEGSRRPTPIEEKFASVGILTHYPSSSSTMAHGHYPSASASVSAPSLEQTTGLPLSLSTSSPHSTLPSGSASFDFPIHDPSWCKDQAVPFCYPHPQHLIEGHSDLVYTICHTERYIISGSRDRSVRVWNARSRRLQYPPLIAHDSSVFCVVADEAQDLIVSCSGDRSIITWQLSTGTLKYRILEAHGDSVLNIKLNNRYLVSTSKDNTAKVWDRKLFGAARERRASEPFPRSVLRGHTAPINAVTLTDTEAVTACGDRQIRIFDLDSGTCLRRMSSHENTIATLQLSNDGRHVISAGGDTDVIIHCKESGIAVARLQGHEDLVRALTIIPEANLIVSGSYDETVGIWGFHEDGAWKKERSLDVKETQRSLGLDVKQQQHSHDFTENIRKAVEMGADAEARSSAKVFCLLAREKQILCGAGSTIVGWNFENDVNVENAEDEILPVAESHKKSKGKKRQLFRSLKDRF